MPLAPGQVALTNARLGKLRLDAGRLDAVLAPPPPAYNPRPVHGFVGGPYVLAWDADGASSYDVRFGIAATPPLVSSAQVGQTYALAPLTPGTVYYWQITTRNTFGSTPGPVWSFTAQVPAAATLVSPANGATDVSNTPTLTWTGPPLELGATYTLFFNNAVGTAPQSFPGLTTTSHPVGPLANAAGWAWRVDTVNNAGATATPVWTFSTWVLGAPTYLSPANGAVEVSLSAVLSWTAALNALSYDVYIGTSPAPAFAANTTGLAYDPALGPQTLYSWRIVARNAGGTVSGPVWSFTTTDPTKPIISIDGVRPDMRIAGLRITDQLNDSPNTCIFTVDTNPPHVGQVVLIGLGGVLVGDLIFAGTIEDVETIYEGRPANKAWRVSCIDWWRRLNRYKVTRHYAEQSATAIVLDLVATYAPDFTTGAVAGGLPTVTGGMDFIHEDLGQCLRRVMTLVGGYWYVDYGKVVHAFLTEVSEAPDPLVPDSATLLNEPSVTLLTDLSQTRTRDYVEGGGSNATTDVAAGGTTIPVEDASWFKPAGGVVVTGTQRIPHTGTVMSAGGSVVQGQTGPSGGGGTPSAALAAVVGGIVGGTNYRASFKNTQGETVPGPASNTVVGVAVASPPSGPGVSFAGGLGRIVGTNLSYKTSYVTDRGETLTGPASAPVSPAAPTVPGAPVVNLGSGIGYLIGAYGYKTTFVTQYGETTGSPAASRTAGALTGPASPGVNINIDNGPLLGNYQWKASFVSADGRESLGPATITVAAVVTTAASPNLFGDGTGNKIDIRVAWFSEWGESQWSVQSTDLNHGNPVVVAPTSFPSDAKGWIAFSSGSYAGTSPGTYFRMPDVYTGGASGNLGPGPGVQVTGAGGTMGKKANVTIATGPTGTVARRLYRTKAGGTDFFLVADVPNNVTTALVDGVPDTALQVAAPLQNLNGQVHALAGIAIGAAGTIARRVYRTISGGSEYKLLVEIADNTTTTFTDNVPDGSLGAALLPLVNTAGGQNVALTVGTGPSGTLARRLYRTKTGGGLYFFLAELSDNSTTAYIDDRLDDELGDSPPLVSEAGASAVTVSSIPIGAAGITGRRLYRLDLAGNYRLVVELKDNTTTTHLDVLADQDLGDVAPTVSTIGALPGATSVLLASTAAFQAAGGWATSGSQHLRYTGISGLSLTGIPASGPGSLVAPLKAGDEVIAESMITGTTIAESIARGETLHVWAEVNDLTAQSELAALEGGGSPGIYEHYIADSRLAWREAEATGTADLRLFARPVQTLRYASRDPQTQTGKTIHAALPALAITGDFVIHTVQIDQIGVSKGLFPRYTVEASSVRFTFEDLLRQVLLPPP